MTGTRLGQWVVDDKIGHGAMGEVYRAHQADHPDHRVAIKMLVAELVRDPVFLMRFQTEIDILRQLDHPRIVRFLDSGLHEGIPYFVMEYVDGLDYDAILRNREPRRLAWTEVIDLAIQVVPALQHAHRRGVVHRDLKPSNILRGRDGTVKLTDFGIARLFVSPASGTGPQVVSPLGSVVGAIAYTAPEQALGKPLTKRSDFYAFGGVLYTLLTGRPPFTGNNVIEVMHKHCFQTPERPSHYVPSLPKEFEDFVLRLLAKEPGARPGDGGVVMKELLRIRGELERRGLIAPLPADQKVAALAPLVAAREFDDDDEELPAPTAPVEPAPPLMSRPVVVVPLALAVFALLAWAINSMISRPTAEQRFAAAEPFLESSRLEDLEKVWNEHLRELADRYPDYRTAEVQAVKQRIDALTSMRRAIASGQLVAAPASEVERLFRQGLSACQAGEYRLARDTWQRLTRAFENVPSARIWVEAAQRGVEKLNEQLAEKSGPRRFAAIAGDESIREAIARIRELREMGRQPEAEAILEALRAAYLGEPDAAEIIPWLESQTKAQ